MCVLMAVVVVVCVCLNGCGGGVCVCLNGCGGGGVCVCVLMAVVLVVCVCLNGCGGGGVCVSVFWWCVFWCMRMVCVHVYNTFHPTTTDRLSTAVTSMHSSALISPDAKILFNRPLGAKPQDDLWVIQTWPIALSGTYTYIYT